MKKRMFRGDKVFNVALIFFFVYGFVLALSTDDIVYFFDDFDSHVFDNWIPISPPKGSSQISFDSINTKHEGSRNSVKFHIEDLSNCGYDKTCIHSGRCQILNACRHLEIKLPASYVYSRSGRDIWYSWSSMFEKLPNNGVEIFLMQFHTQKTTGGSPAIFVKLLKDSSITIGSKQWLIDEHGDRILHEKNLRRPVYRTKSITADTSFKIRAQVWYDFKLRVRWAHWKKDGKKGLVEIEIIEKGMKNPWKTRLNSISTMNSDNQYLMIGAYWGNKGPSETILYIDDFKISSL